MHRQIALHACAHCLFHSVTGAEKNSSQTTSLGSLRMYKTTQLVRAWQNVHAPLLEP